MSVAVLGAGLSGLAISRCLASQGRRVVCFEAKDHVGGWVSSERTSPKTDDDGVEYGGVLLEKGPHSMRPRSEGNGLRLVQLLVELGLDRDALCSEGSERYVWHDSKLVRLPTSLPDVVRNPLTRHFPLNLARDFFSLPLSPPREESIGQYVTRKFGPEAKPLFTGMVAGIFAGNMDELSMSSCFPQIMELDSLGGGSLVRGMLRKKRSVVAPGMEKLLSASSISFPNGMGTLRDVLRDECQRLGVDFRLNSPVSRVDKKEVNGELGFDHVVSTLPISTLASSLHPSSASHHALSQLANEFLNRKVDVVVVNLSYSASQVPLLPPNAFGHLVTQVHVQAETGVLGVLYDSCAFPGQQPGQEHVVLSVMMGGAHASWVGRQTEKEWVILARKAVRQQLNFTDLPREVSAVRHSNCIPQYRVGHLEAKTNALEVVRKEFGEGLSVLGTGVLGVGIADSVGGGLLAVERMMSKTVHV